MTYELMVLISPTVDLTTDKAQRDIVEKLVGSSAAVKEVTSLGKKRMSYEIKKQSEATYLVAVLEGMVKTAEIEQKAKLMDDVLRYLVTVKE